MNVLLLSIDCLRYDSLGVFGNKNHLTPFLDSVSEQCIIFTQAHSTGPYTQASFPGILTSSYYLDFGRTPYLSTQRTLISEVLQKNGIVTAAFHSNPYLSEFFGWNRGWNTFYDSMNEEVSEKQPFISGHAINMKVRNWFKTKKEGPFFLWVHYMDVHEPYIPKKEYLNSVYPELDINEDEMFTLFKEVLLKRDISDKNKVLLLKKLYDAKVREVDDYVKELFAILEEFSLLKDTWIIILSDHGDEFSEHGGLSHDGKMYEELIHVPLLIRHPSEKKKIFYNKFVS
ncbi:MAG: sulfatase, partial [Nitrososphaeria archaeon]